MSESRILPTDLRGGANAWFEVKVTRTEPNLSDNHLILGGVEIPTLRVKSLEATAKTTTTSYSKLVAFRIPPGTPAGKRGLAFKTCVAAPEIVSIEVLPSPAPLITSVAVVQNGQWPSLVIKGVNLTDADQIILASGESVSIAESITRVNDTELRGPIEHDVPGTYDVFVHTPFGLGGGPPNGVVSLR